jgi:thymidylate kinase
LAYLQPRVDRDRLYDILQQCLPFIDKHLFEACERSLSTDCLITERISTGRRLQKRLRAHARRQHVFELGLKFKRRLMRGIRRRLPGHLPKKRLTSGGAMIALVGGDGAGKSTATGELYSWLSDNFDTIRIHLGRPSWSWLTYVVRAGRKVGQLVSHSPAAERKKSDPVKDLTPWSATSYSKALWYVCVARDRYRAYTRARRFATNGGIVICDRFPLEQVRLMDGPRIKPGKNSRIVTFLGRLERNYYLPMTPPEVLIVLKVDPDIAVRRKTEEDPVSVRRRSMEIWQSDWQETQAHVIDASRSPKEVLSELKSLIWSEL